MARILVVDDEPRMAELVALELADHGHEVETAADGARALDLLRTRTRDLVVTDLKMPGLDGLELLAEIKKLWPGTEVILMTAYASARTAVSAMKEGAWDYLIKPFEMDELLIMVDRIVRERRLQDENRELRAAMGDAGGEIVGQSEALAGVLDLVARVASQEATVLITGESGTGKELIARAIHAASPRAREPFVVVNCAALPDTLLESELFGHEKGAFTGAERRRPGRFELADGGTLFLDEVSEITPSAQVKLLRVLQERTLERLGSTETFRIDVRVLAATNRDLAVLVETGNFREDLFYRLNVFPLHLPPLRERREDIPELARHFLARRVPPVAITEAALEILMSYDWPGNVRELENVLERAGILAGPGREIGAVDLDWLMSPPAADHGAIPGSARGGRIQIPEEGVDLEALEKEHILEALRTAGGNKTEAARLLHMSRRRLYSRLDHHGIAYRQEAGEWNGS